MPLVILGCAGCPSGGERRFDAPAAPSHVASGPSALPTSPPIELIGRAEPDGGGSPLAVASEAAALPTASPATSSSDGSAGSTGDEGPLLGPPDSIPECETKLTEAGVRFAPHPLPVHRERGIECGAPQVVEYKSGPIGIRWSPAPVVSCGLALALARFERMIDDEAKRDLGVGIARIEQAGTYSCRSMARFRQVSEHAYANAIDLRSFQTTSGKKIAVLQHFGTPGRDPPTREGDFLRRMARRAYDDGIFSVVVTRFFDELHRDHVHVDMARYHVDGSR